ncbi:MAG: S1C family serine protease [Opitutales bacterium]|nr:S1C family serine protease [Opitutales bacterium]
MQSFARTKFFSVLLFSLINSVVGEQNYLSSQLRVQELFKKYENSLVRVKATRQDLVDGKTKRLLKMGSGFFVSQDGHILTTGVLQNADRVWVEHKSKFFLTETIGSDSLCNLTLLKTLEKPEKFNYVSFSSDQSDVQVGSFLLGITCALEFEIGPTIGLLQSKESSFGSTLFPTKMLRTSLSLGPGEVGSPVFDLNGNFIGITYAALPDLRSSFILSAKSCARIRDGLLLSGNVDYGWFGITVSRTINKHNSFNIEIKSVGDNSNLEKGDVILKIGNTEILKRGDIVDSTFFARPGTFIEFLIQRAGKKLTVPVRVSSRPSQSKMYGSVQDKNKRSKSESKDLTEKFINPDNNKSN